MVIVVPKLCLTTRENFDCVDSLIKQYPTVKRIIVDALLDWREDFMGHSILNFQEYYGEWIKKNVIIQDRFGCTVTHRIKTILEKQGLEKTILLMDFFCTQGIDVNILSQRGRTPLHEAVVTCQKELVKLFLKYGANPALRDNEQDKPFNIIKRIRKAIIRYPDSDFYEEKTQKQKEDIPQIIELLKKYPCNKDKSRKKTAMEKIKKYFVKKYHDFDVWDESSGLCFLAFSLLIYICYQKN